MDSSTLTPDLWALFAVLILTFAHLGLSSIVSLNQLGARYILSPRDELQEAQGIAGRIVRSYRNLLESFAQFAASLFLVHAADAVGMLAAIGAWTFFAGRLLYIPAYAVGPSGVRPACWMTAQIGMLIILADLFW
ncbi:MAPEG family protein [Parasphingopyxis sp.]|uniref:MAPEG family protein n=1 Tax=Parasphingopyxis sp. TaxID=1920299 RepID=UPI00261214C7|nr:MAPEG family protein [Parasphingopyxis sp.]